jgi:hypothetical protein
LNQVSNIPQKLVPSDKGKVFIHMSLSNSAIPLQTFKHIDPSRYDHIQDAPTKRLGNYDHIVDLPQSESITLRRADLSSLADLYSDEDEDTTQPSIMPPLHTPLQVSNIGKSIPWWENIPKGKKRQNLLLIVSFCMIVWTLSIFLLGKAS